MAISSLLWNPGRVAQRLWDTFAQGWYLGFTAFGGPPVHFKIFHDKYVDKLGWVDEQVYQELFAVCQAFSGPASTKMLYALNLIHDGFVPAIVAFLIWSLPGACGMYGLSVGVSHVGDKLPQAVYALLSGLNAATVGIIALAAVQLAQKAITDKMTRILVFLGGAAGLMFNALWYFPLLLFLAGCSSILHDYRLLHPIFKWILSRRRKQLQLERGEESAELPVIAPQEDANREEEVQASRSPKTASASGKQAGESFSPVPKPSAEQPSPRIIPAARTLTISWQFGTTILILFVLIFIVLMVLRGVLTHPPVLFSFFTNMFLAGTIIFGGGPVVIPLLRSYVVAEGWVSPRDFLIGLALIQAFPGPNFNFAVYLGGLVAFNAGQNNASGSIMGYLGIFFPGLITVHGTMGIWSALRTKRWVKSALRGVNAAAVGLIYTAVYKLWQTGFLDEGFDMGRSLGDDAWWVVVGATSYVGGMWFGVSAPVAIALGAVMGLVRYGVVSR